MQFSKNYSNVLLVYALGNLSRISNAREQIIVP